MMANLTREQEWADRNHDRRICWFPENGGCTRHNPNMGWTYKSNERLVAERHAELALEVQELNRQTGKNVKYSPERGVYL